MDGGNEGKMMATALDEEKVTKEMQNFDVTAQVLKQMKTDYMPLAIASIDDKDGYKQRPPCGLQFPVSRSITPI